MITGSCRGETKPQVSKETLDFLRNNQDAILERQKQLTVKGVQGVTPGKDVWTKWHQNQMLTTEIKKDLSKVPNARYMAVRDDGCVLFKPIWLKLVFELRSATSLLIIAVFFQIVNEIVNPQALPKLIHWVERLKDEHKKVCKISHAQLFSLRNKYQLGKSWSI